MVWSAAALLLALAFALVPRSAAAQPAEPQATAAQTSPAQGPRGEALYEALRAAARGEGAGATLFDRLSAAAANLEWESAETQAFFGHLRLLTAEGAGEAEELFLVRELSGKVYVLALPEDGAALAAGSGSPYAGLRDLVKYKLDFRVQMATAAVDGASYQFVRFAEAPQRMLLDRLFFIAIVVLLFFVMVGMGLTLTTGDFALVFKKPRGMVVGPILQFGLLPLIAMVLGRLAGFYETYPFIFLGLILVAASPGGVTSNLMTYLGKGDVALSVSLTALCTVLSLLFTPLLLTLYGSNIPDFSIPVMDVIKTMLVLVIVPLFVGMVVRGKWPGFARKAEKPFALLGVFALLFLIVVGIWSNLDKFADTDRYGLKFYAVVFLLTLLGMVIAGAISKGVGINNYQTRAISLEVGLRNASLSMTIALLLQDQMGDFSSSMFFSSGIFGLWMYFAGALTIFGFKRVLPVAAAEIEASQPQSDEAKG
ncbi:MAG: bile acid:sodium symporter [Deltaproteobacteria bacterium]|jgi:BASS family bile acid:Na+ symporter|nr:bile acid:sodium symporter [Deltaproteobacteria bacterium]MBW2533170.1 bile acid:sodium symporter [Deltaproteobacteria bacterium]